MNIRDLEVFFEEIRRDFPILKQEVNGKNIIYVDNGATTQKPLCVIEKIEQFYKDYNSNIHRSAHTLANKSDKAYENVRKIVGKFINAKPNCVIFTKGATQSLNFIAFGMEKDICKGDEILLSVAEHHANLVPWQEIAKKKGAILKFIPLNENFEIDIKNAKELINSKTKVISIPLVSNVLGGINNIKKVFEIAKSFGTRCILDATQGAQHFKVNIEEIGADAIVFSSHKMLGPTGVGVLTGKFDFLNSLSPQEFGGDMIDEVDLKFSTFSSLPHKLEAGTPNIAGVIGFGEAIEYLNKITFEKIEVYERYLTKYFLEKFSKLKNKDKIQLLGPKTKENRIGVFAINYKGIHSHDLATIFDKYGIATRSGHHCAMPLHNILKVNSTLRISLYFYNTTKEIDKIMSVLENAEEIFKKGEFL